jgi:hypothetical protein
MQCSYVVKFAKCERENERARAKVREKESVNEREREKKGVNEREREKYAKKEICSVERELYLIYFLCTRTCAKRPCLYISKSLLVPA